MSQKITLRKIELCDLPQIARVHMSSFPASALTKLGHKVVERYYHWQLTGPHPKVWAIGAYDGETCAGFLFGGVFRDSTSGFVANNKLLLITEVLRRPQLLSQLGIYEKIRLSAKMIIHHKRTQQNQENQQFTDAKEKTSSFGVLAIGVSATSQKMGIGQQLMSDAEDEAVRCGYEQMDLTVHPKNTKAISFYEKLHWEKVFAGGKWKGVMIKKLGSKSVSSAEIRREIVTV